MSRHGCRRRCPASREPISVCGGQLPAHDGPEWSASASVTHVPFRVLRFLLLLILLLLLVVIILLLHGRDSVFRRRTHAPTSRALPAGCQLPAPRTGRRTRIEYEKDLKKLSNPSFFFQQFYYNNQIIHFAIGWLLSTWITDDVFMFFPFTFQLFNPASFADFSVLFQRSTLKIYSLWNSVSCTCIVWRGGGGRALEFSDDSFTMWRDLFLVHRQKRSQNYASTMKWLQFVINKSECDDFYGRAPTRSFVYVWCEQGNYAFCWRIWLLMGNFCSLLALQSRGSRWNFFSQKSVSKWLNSLINKFSMSR